MTYQKPAQVAVVPDRRSSLPWWPSAALVGVSDFPDPDASGQFAYGIKAGSPLIPTTLTSRQIAERLKSAQYVRTNGLPGFPDFSNNGPLINVQNGQRNPEIQSAIQKRRALLATALAGQ